MFSKKGLAAKPALARIRTNHHSLLRTPDKTRMSISSQCSAMMHKLANRRLCKVLHRNISELMGRVLHSLRAVQ